MNQSLLLSSIFIIILSLSVSSFSYTFLSDDVFESQVHKGRNLLQTRKGCSVNFEFLNYTIITSRCKGPAYLPKDCCAAFKDFACPYADVLNDLQNDCASTMFSYINLYGQYPPGLFANECREGKDGLACPALPPSESANDTGNQITHCPSLLLLLLTACSLIMLF
ncbi:PREDICTED: GPI-anchored protein LLG1 [Lupinus angustifolius]|uniref:GPI-anchored protein LLG1 n=1 Tax=Lupinus angustifolius TaxID=3871 RepID=UPI00092FA759|nr:PREDICTED: GPI-anchored protein LLG1 [Lupinus angustifolius]